MPAKLLFVLPSLAGGGAEKVMLRLLRFLDRQSFQLHLALVKLEGPYLDQIPADVQVHALHCSRVRFAWLPLLRLIRRLRPDTVMTTIGHLNLFAVLLKPFFKGQTRLIVREVTPVSAHYTGNLFWATLYHFLYPRADLVICQSDYMLEDLAIHFQVPRQKMVRIYNPVDFTGIRKMMEAAENPFAGCGKGPHLLCVGRLAPEKGFNRLILAMPALLAAHPQADLWFLGEGPMKEKLKADCRGLGIEHHVHFKGFQADPIPWYKNANLFLLPSYYEGLPNALLEAIACGCPVIALDHPGGTREIMDLTNLGHRLVSRLDWQNDWFQRETEAADRLIPHFGLSTILDEYAHHLGKGNKPGEEHHLA